jgi:hypothetical protein
MVGEIDQRTGTQGLRASMRIEFDDALDTLNAAAPSVMSNNGGTFDQPLLAFDDTGMLAVDR